MSPYNKKNVKKHSLNTNNRKGRKSLKSYSTVSKKDKKQRDVISMTQKPKKKIFPKTPNVNMKLILGKKETYQKRRIFALALCFVLLVAIVLFSVLTPTTPFEYLQNKIYSIGNGSFPANISGSELRDCYLVDSLYYTLSDTHAEVFNKAGKQLFSRQHDFNLPALCVSAQRALVYDLGGRSAYVFNNNEVISKLSTKYDIYCASISRNGTVAVASKSKSYASQVQVLSKNGKEKFAWFSSTEIINNVALSNNGRCLAVSTVNTEGGKFKSKVYVFKYSSAKPLYEFSYDGEIVLSIDCVSSSRFTVVTDKKTDFIKWRNGSRTSHDNRFKLSIFKTFDNKKSIAVLGNKSSSSVVLYNHTGKKITEVEYNGSISDAYIYGSKIYLLIDSYVYVIDHNAKQIAKPINVSGYSRVFSVDNNNIISVGNFGLDKFKIDWSN